ncbi:MAG TPA: GNAT family N-acetyltransferase [Tepidisphaeraceae bacterium]|jgi:ribosomal protein S18 acetylase RimI-like enzyme|nr:GNAT family N-acetyltransferase [Tepidisphaeraceae bacterium]
MLSNFFRPITPATSVDGPLLCRAAQRGEFNDAIKLILSTNNRPASDAQVVDFLRYAVHRDINLNDLWLALRDGRLVWAALPVVNPGRTMLLLMPDEPPTTDSPAAVALLNAVCDHFGGRGITLAQALLEPGATVADLLATQAGFLPLAELIYLQADIRRVPTAAQVGIHWRTYSSAAHDLFARTILQTYADSLDCPALNGLRDIEDIIVGHKGPGAFRPDLWLLATDDTGTPLGVLLLAQIADGDTLELVYLGVVPAARGRGIAQAMMREAMAIGRSLQATRLTLAVDSRNTPALRLYYGHGLQRFASKVALIRDLRRPASVTAPALSTPLAEPV